MTNDNGPRVTVSVEMKVNLGNYESAGVGLILSGIAPGTSEEEIAELLDTGKIAYDKMREHLKEKVAETRAGK